jgi:hypothetical protein
MSTLRSISKFTTQTGLDEYNTLSLVSDRLFLTGLDGVIHVPELTRRGVSHVLSVLDPSELPGTVWVNNLSDQKIVHHLFILQDREDVRLLDVLGQVRTLMKRIHSSSVTNVIVIHCQLGRSRSATCVLDYWLFNNDKLTVDTALRNLRQKRSVVQPNWYFMDKLKTLYNQSHRTV